MKIRCSNCMTEYEPTSTPGVCPRCGYRVGTPPKEQYHLHPGTILNGRYEIGTVDAFGGFGIIYRAWDNTLQVMLAIKEYFPTSYVYRNPNETEVYVYTEKRREEFLKGKAGFLEEARNTARFSEHENIVKVYDYFEENGTAYMVMEYMQGMSLKDYVQMQGGSIPWTQVVQISCSIMNILSVVHAEGILHRDISPDNIMLCTDGKVKLFDFGAARFSSNEEQNRTVILKIGYAPPEQYRKKSAQGPWTDVYALGATMYRCITGRQPEESVNREEAISLREPDPLVNPAQIVQDLPDYLDAAIMRALSMNRELRFQNMTQFKNAILNRRHVNDPEQEIRRKKRLRRIGITTAMAGVCVIALGCLAIYRTKQNEADLNGAVVSVWTMDDAALVESMLSEFAEDYPQVQIAVTSIAADQYEDELRTAIEEGNVPTLFEIPESMTDLQTGDLATLYENLQEEDYCYLDAAREQYGTGAIPLGWHTLFAYTNTSYEDTTTTQNDLTAFLDGESAMVIADETVYQEVQQRIPGEYNIACYDQESVYVQYDKWYGISPDASELDTSAAERVLEYLLGESAQDVIGVQNREIIPLNRAEADVLWGINVEMSAVQTMMEQGTQPRLYTGTDLDSLAEERLQGADESAEQDGSQSAEPQIEESQSTEAQSDEVQPEESQSGASQPEETQ